MSTNYDNEAVVLHIPHASSVIPTSCRQDFLLTDTELEEEVLAVTDWFTDELFHLEGASRAVFPISRMVVDPERFADDAAEPQAEVGRGVIYTQTVDGKVLRDSVSSDKRDHLLSQYYSPHHAKLTELVSTAVQKSGACLIIDCHSFPAKALPYELDCDAQRLDICIGTDPYHTQPILLETVLELFEEKGFSTTVNRPYSGSLVPLEYYRKEKNIYSIMIEVNRRLYMNEQSGEKSEHFEEISIELTEILEKLKSISLRQNIKLHEKR